MQLAQEWKKKQIKKIKVIKRFIRGYWREKKRLAIVFEMMCHNPFVHFFLCLFLSHTVDDVEWKWAVGNGQWRVYSAVDGVCFVFDSNLTAACVPIPKVIKFTIYFKATDTKGRRIMERIIINKPLKYSNFQAAGKTKYLLIFQNEFRSYPILGEK